jgi:hypothetical protein
MTTKPIPDADEADLIEQAEAVVDVEPPDGLPGPAAHALPVDASEGDALEQSIEVPVDDDERY